MRRDSCIKRDQEPTKDKAVVFTSLPMTTVRRAEGSEPRARKGRECGPQEVAKARAVEGKRTSVMGDKRKEETDSMIRVGRDRACREEAQATMAGHEDTGKTSIRAVLAGGKGVHRSWSTTREEPSLEKISNPGERTLSTEEWSNRAEKRHLLDLGDIRHIG